MATMKYYNVNTPPTAASPEGTYYVKRTDNPDRIDIYVVSKGVVKKLDNSEDRVAQIEQTMVTQEDLDNLNPYTNFGDLSPYLQNLPFLLSAKNPIVLGIDAPTRTGYFQEGGLGSYVNSATWRTHQDKAIIVNSPGIRVFLNVPGTANPGVQFAVMDIFNNPLISEVGNSILIPENGYYLRINYWTGALANAPAGVTYFTEALIKTATLTPIFQKDLFPKNILESINLKTGAGNSWLVQNNLYLPNEFYSGFYNNVGVWQAAVNLTVGWLSMRFGMSSTVLRVKKGSSIYYEVDGLDNVIIRMRIQRDDGSQVTYSNTWKSNTPTTISDDGILVLMLYTGTIDNTVTQLTKSQAEKVRVVGIERDLNRRLEVFENPDISPPVWVLPRIVNNPLPIGKETLKVLLIGNSYSQNLTNRLGTLLEHSGIDQSKLNVSYVMIGGATLETWWNSYSAGSSYSLTRQAGTITMPITSGSLANLLSQDWDIIVLQQYNTSSNYSTYNPYLTNLMKAIRTNCSNSRLSIVANIVWSWAESYSRSSAELHWSGIIEATKQMVIKDGIDVLIPSGTAIQNARDTSLGLIGNELTRDGIHLIPGIGEYIAACAFFQSIISPVFGTPMFGNPANHTVTPNEITIGGVSVTNDNRELCQKCALMAWIDPYNITEINE